MESKNLSHSTTALRSIADRITSRFKRIVADLTIDKIILKEGLKVPPRARKRRRLGERASGAQRKRAERINHVWSYDFVFDQTERGTRLK
ncbi:MAG: hypothetical protein WAN16_11160 [Chthoniobacterales bacterium]